MDTESFIILVVIFMILGNILFWMIPKKNEKKRVNFANNTETLLYNTLTGEKAGFIISPLDGSSKKIKDGIKWQYETGLLDPESI